MKTDLPSFDTCLEKTLRCSRFAQHSVRTRPQLVDELRRTYLDPVSHEQMQRILGVGRFVDDSALKSALRSLRQSVVLRTLLRDLNGLANLDEVVSVTSDLAETALKTALAFFDQSLRALHGAPIGLASGKVQDLIIVGMGKLGGRELNVSSDIDLVFVYGEEGETHAADHAKRLSNQEYFTRLGKKLVTALDEVTEDGFVFRVDMRLRPFGDSGPLAVNIDALEHYFITSARPWERYAWLKARALTGNAAELEALTRPFVYRKYHDYGALQDLRDLHAQIRGEAQRKNRLSDIKVGPGGIREIEFVAQLFQLIRGGRETRLQTFSTRAALERIKEGGLLPADAVAQLTAAYEFLRNLEHRLQYLDDAQTQALPNNDQDRAIIADAMQFADVNRFDAALNWHRSFVSKEFDAMFATPESVQAAQPRDAANEAVIKWSADWLDNVESYESLREYLKNQGFHDAHADQIVLRLTQWRHSSRYRFLTEKGRIKFERLIPAALKAAAAEGAKADAFLRIFDVLEAVDRRDAYLSLLIENPDVLQRVARLAVKSAWAAGLLKRHPILLDELVQTRASSLSVNWRVERTRLEVEVLAAELDTERQYDLLRHFKQVHTLRLNIADVDGRLSVMALADELCALADLLLDLALALAWRVISKENTLTTPPGFAVIGYGKLGSKELGYASDLDLIFLYDETSSLGADNYARLSQRFNQWLNAATSGGVLYETDLRLRPDGASGMMVTGVNAFHEYLMKRAWTWEHQALTRARFCAGDPGLAPRFDMVRKAILTTPRDIGNLREDIVTMRSRMRTEHPDHPDRGGNINLKHTRGGIIDLEFIVQFLVLVHAQKYPGLVRNAGNFALLHVAGEAGLISGEIGALAAQAYLAFRARQHLARNNNEMETLIEMEELRAERAAVSSLWDAVFGEKASGHHLQNAGQ